MQQQLLTNPVVDIGLGSDNAVGTANTFIYNALQIGLIQNLIVDGGDWYFVAVI